jgi:hypothetical protein
MLITADSTWRRWTGSVILEHCPWEKPGCADRGCWAAALCRAARSAQGLGLWQMLALERDRETLVWTILAIGGLGVLLLALAWP